MLTLGQLLAATPIQVVNRAKRVIIQPYKDEIIVRPRSTYRRIVLKTVAYDSTKETNKMYLTEVRLAGFGDSPLSDKAWVRCSCPFFLYNSEVAIFDKGSTNIKYSNGQPPEVKNPEHKPMVCKHLVASALYIRRAMTH